MRSLLSFLLICLSLTLLDTALAQSASDGGRRVTYVVKSGDSPIAIAKRFSVSVDDLLEVNGVSNPKKLRPGKTLIIPVKGSSSRAKKPVPAEQSASADEAVAEETDKKDSNVDSGDVGQQIAKIASKASKQNADKKNSAAPAAKKTESHSMMGVETGDDASPLFVKSDSLMLDSKKRIFTYKGNVEIIRGDLTITSDLAIGNYDENGKIQRVTCQDNVVITRGESMRASANHALYIVERAVIELTESPELFDRGNALTADKVVVFVDEDRSEAEGNVRVKVIKAENSPDGNSLTDVVAGGGDDGASEAGASKKEADTEDVETEEG